MGDWHDPEGDSAASIADRARRAHPSIDLGVARGVRSRIEIVKRLDWGGMGVVYEAWQLGHESERPAAYKVIRPDLASDPKLIAQFRREVRALMRIKGRGVPYLHDTFLDEDRDRPAYSMELLEGQTLHAHLRAAAKAPEMARDWDRAVRPVREAAEVLARAHRARIIHGDIKPKNLLITSDERTIVLDWGLARFLDDPESPDSSEFGTDGYRDPDRKPGELATEKDDIHGLGMTLAAILYGLDPAARPDLGAAGHRPDRPAPPRGLVEIFERATGAGGRARYGSMVEMVGDLDRWSELSRNRRDKPWLAVAAVLVSLSLATFVALTGEGRARKARRDVDESMELLIGNAEAMGAAQATLPRARKTLDDVAVLLDRLAVGAEGDPARAAEAAGFRLRVGKIRYKLNQIPEAGRHYLKAIELARKALALDPGDRSSGHLLASALRDQGVIEARLGRFDLARPLVDEALAVLDPIVGPESDPVWRLTLARIHLLLGNLARGLPDRPRMHREFARGLAIATDRVREAPDDRAALAVRAMILDNGGMFTMEESAPFGFVLHPTEHAEVVERHRDALAIRRGLLAHDPSNADEESEVVSSLTHLGNALLVQGKDKYAEAEAAYAEANARIGPLVRAYPGMADFLRQSCQLDNNLVELRMRRGEWRTAQATNTRLIADARTLALQFPHQPEHLAELIVILERQARLSRRNDPIAEANEAEYAVAVEQARLACLIEEVAPDESLASTVALRLNGLIDRHYFEADERRSAFLSESTFDRLRSRPDFARLPRR